MERKKERKIRKQRIIIIKKETGARSKSGILDSSCAKNLMERGHVHHHYCAEAAKVSRSAGGARLPSIRR